MKSFNPSDPLHIELFNGAGAAMLVTNLVYRAQTQFQRMIIFDNPTYGRLMSLDGIVQVSTADEHVYHEMIIHPAMAAHGKVLSVLVIGGGDGGAIRRVLEWPVERVVMVDLDEEVVRACETHIPEISRGAFRDPRLELRFGDGLAYLREQKNTFDVIISDLTDPHSEPAELLYGREFFKDVKLALRKGGIFINQNGPAITEVESAHRAILELQAAGFEHTCGYWTEVSAYAGGPTLFGWASDTCRYADQDPAILDERLRAANIKTRYFSGRMGTAAHVLAPNLAAWFEQS